MRKREVGEKMSEIPQEFRVESFGWLRERHGVREESVQRLSLSRIRENAAKRDPDLLKRVEEYYVEEGWLLAAAEVAKQISSVEALERAEQYYVKGRFFRSAIEVAERIGTPEALKRAGQYRVQMC